MNDSFDLVNKMTKRERERERERERVKERETTSLVSYFSMMVAVGVNLINHKYVEITILLKSF